MVIKKFLKNLIDEKLSDVEILEKFVSSMCPFVAGMPPGSIKKLPMITEKKKDV